MFKSYGYAAPKGTMYPGVFNYGCDHSFHRQVDLTRHLHHCNINPKLSENIKNIPVDELSIDRTTSYSIQSTASSTFCPEVSQGKVIILVWARQVTCVCICVSVCLCVSVCMSVPLSVCVCMCLHVCLCLSVCICRSMCMSICVSPCLLGC